MSLYRCPHRLKSKRTWHSKVRPELPPIPSLPRTNPLHLPPNHQRPRKQLSNAQTTRNVTSPPKKVRPRIATPLASPNPSLPSSFLTAVLLQIDLDKKARAERNAREKALREGRAPPPVVETPAAAPSSSTPGEKKVYTTTRLQIRLPSGGPPLVTTVESGSTLGMLRTWVGEQEAAGAVEEIVFSSAFPRLVLGVLPFFSWGEWRGN